MQLLAIDENGDLILSLDAKKKITYICPECEGPVRLRSGRDVQPHFFHKKKHLCRHDAKGLDHLQVQLRLHKELPEALLEERFPQLGRVADICSHSLKLVIEIQCSSLSLSEIKERTQDYESLGYTVIWILHTKQFLQPRAHSIEKFLEKRPHYFTDINHLGQGMIFDQLSFIVGGKRTLLGDPFPLSFTTWPLQDLRNLRKAYRKKQPSFFINALKVYAKMIFKMLLENSCREK